MSKGKIVEVQILEQKTIDFKDLKQGTIFRVVTEGGENKPNQTSDWNVALVNPKTTDDGVKFTADKITFLIGKPETVEVGVVRDEVEYKGQSLKGTVAVEGATIQ